MSVVNSDNLTKVTPRIGQPVVEINGAKYPLAFKVKGDPATFTEDIERGVVEVSKGEVSEDFEFQLTTTVLGRVGLNVYAGPGYIPGTATLKLPEAEITTDKSGTVITSGFVTETVEIPPVVMDGGGLQQVRFGVVDADGKFQTLDLSGDTPVAVGVSEDVDYTVFATDRPHPEPSTGGGSSGGDSISQLVKVSEFIAPHDAYSAVESIEVSGLGERETWDGDIDFSIWNGTYVVTPETAGETSTEKRIYKHSSDSKYLYRMFCMDNQEYYWILDDGTGAENVYDSWFADSDLESGSWFCYPYDLSCTITLNKTMGTYPDQELVLKVQPATGSSISNDLRTWEFGAAVDVTKYETTPTEGAMHVLLGGELLSNKVYPSTTQGVNGLLFYAPLTSADNDLVVGSYTASKPFEYSEYGAELESLYLLTDVPVSALQGDFTFFAEVTVHDTSHEHPIFAAYDSNYMIGLDTTGNAYSMYAGFSTWDWNILTGNNGYTPDENNVSGRGSIATTQDVTQKVAMTRNGDIWELYVDNVLSLRRNRPGTIRASGYIALHRWGSGDGSMTNAPTAMKNVKIYSRGMTAEEIAQL